MSRWTWGLGIVLAAAAAVPAAETPEFNVDFSVGWGGCYRPMEWTAVEVGITTNLTEPLGGTLTLTGKQDDLTELTVAHKLVHTPGLPLHLPLVMKLTFGLPECVLTFYDGRGRTVWRRKYEFWGAGYGPGPLTPVQSGDLLVGLVGGGSFGLRYLPSRAVCETPGQRGKVHVKDKRVRMLPRDWTGYASLDLLVLCDVDFNELHPDQSRAIAEWVSNGGKLLILLGTHPLPPENAITALVPVELATPKPVRLEASKLRAWGLTNAATDTLPCWLGPDSVRARPAVPWLLQDVGGQPIYLLGAAGFGRVGVLGIDPSALGGTQQANVASFWVELMKPLLDGRSLRLISDAERRDGYGSRYNYELGKFARGSNAVLEHLLDIPELRPLSIWVIVGLLAALAVALGPVDYFVLKRLGRLPLTWLTATAIVALFSVGAYYGVRALRAGSLTVRVVSVADGLQGADHAWSTTYSGIFAPASDDYALSGLEPGQWWSAITPTLQEQIYVGPGGSLASRQLHCLQQDGSNLPVSIPINIWSMQCLLTESRQSPVPISAELRRTGRTVRLTLHNHADTPIARGCLRLGDNLCMELGPVPARGSRDFAEQLRGGEPWEICLERLESRQPWRRPGRDEPPSRFDADTACFAQGTLARTEAIQRYLAAGAAVVCAEYEQAPVAFKVSNRRCRFDHIQLARLVVFEVPDPAGAAQDQPRQGS